MIHKNTLSATLAATLFALGLAGTAVADDDKTSAASSTAESVNDARRPHAGREDGKHEAADKHHEHRVKGKAQKKEVEEHEDEESSDDDQEESAEDYHKK
ncbi:MAG: hypothetical protein Q7U07_07320 [Gammaproteobacteria bacterium]|nr:hypothetical protein [Gammaproteobacteria bacterium]